MASHAALVLCLVLPLAISPWGFDDAYYLKEALLLLVGGGLLLGEGVALWRGKEERVVLPLPLLVFLVFVLASALWAMNLWAFAFRFALLLAGLAVFVVVGRSASVTGRAAGFLSALCISAAVATGYGVIQRLGLDPFLGPDSRFIATFGNSHLYAEFVGPLIPVAFSLVIVARNVQQTGFAMAGLGLLAAGLLWSRARGPALAALAGLTFLLWASWVGHPNLSRMVRRRAWACTGILIGVAGLMATSGNMIVLKPWWAVPPAPYISRGSAVVTPVRGARTGDLGVDFRLAVYRDTLAMIAARPLTGVGLGNFRVNYGAFGKAVGSTFPDMGNEVVPVGHVHNDVLEVAAELGIPAAAIFVWIFVVFVKAGVIGIAKAPLDEAWPRPAAAAGLLALAISGLFAFGFYDPATSLELWVFAGIAMASTAAGKVGAFPEVFRTGGQTWARHGGAILLGGLGLATAWLGVSSELADRFLLQGLARFSRGQYAEALAPLGTAARLEVGRTEAKVMLAQANLGLGRLGPALAVLEQARSLEPYNVQVQYLRGVVLTRLGRVEEGRRAEERAVALYPLYSLPHVALAEQAERQGDEAGARAEYAAALQANPWRAEARDGLALLAVKAGNLDEAIRLWEEGARLDPNDATTAHNLGAAYGRKGDPARAATWDTKAAALRGGASHQ